jgi:hypothetical protein
MLVLLLGQEIKNIRSRYFIGRKRTAISVVKASADVAYCWSALLIHFRVAHSLNTQLLSIGMHSNTAENIVAMVIATTNAIEQYMTIRNLSDENNRR